MKNKSWIIILIMGIALTISLVYSIIVSQRQIDPGESTVTTRSIIEMTATTITIKNTLAGNGIVEIESEDIKENITENITSEETPKKYIITLSIEDKNLDKAKIGQEVDINIKNGDAQLDYLGKVIKINEVVNNKSTINVELLNSNEHIKENLKATCTIIIEKAENVVALPIEAIQKDLENKEYVDVVGSNGLTTKKYITTGISDDYYVEITSGLKVGDRVQIIKSSTTVVEKNSNTTKNWT